MDTNSLVKRYEELKQRKEILSKKVAECEGQLSVLLADKKKMEEEFEEKYGTSKYEDLTELLHSKTAKVEEYCNRLDEALKVLENDNSELV